MNYAGHLIDKEGNIYYPKTVIKITTGEEFKTGRIIDGKMEYGMRFKPITLPSSAGNVVIFTGLENINFIKLEGAIIKKDGSESSNLPYLYSTYPDVYHYFNSITRNITVRATGDRSDFEVIETIYYTKN